ncbi:ABC transporter ATP-binding protein [Pseudogracilibacillus auburnensis]|uniref:ABC-2 type transport system ATP-binding protein n=1 Tax=Pseudogracilibacillus auburnensis TaxID=1494959 RepID=A0A2V3WL32_9BACI|nr:ABC transporter ATP-binding protein [Pseudogracilibacillus auburnensis]PXW89439.1 ABC-2 type transport system ATP-binding protein [Pseudogracilibacillus auburnensis]
MIETIQLSKVYKDKTVVNDVNLYLDQGESVGLLGPNGAGKSTTISMISSLLKPTSGDVKLNGKSVINDPSDLRKVLGVVPQEIALYQELSAYENLKFFGRIYQVPKDQLESRIQETLEMVGLKDRQKDMIKTFSGGMKRRVNIATALLHNPKVLILDEPTVGIDPQSRNYILEMVRQLNEQSGTTVLYTSHYMEEVEQLCHRVYIMDHGRVIASGNQSELLSILSNEDTIKVQLNQMSEDFLQAIQDIDIVRQVEETGDGIKIIAKKSRNIISDLVKLADKENIQILNFQMENPSLEDIFLHLTGRTLRD